MPDDSSSHPGFSYRHPVFLRARNEAFARSGGVCQLCGQMPAEHAHHWAETYPPADKTTAHDLTGLCAECHLIFVTHVPPVHARRRLAAPILRAAFGGSRTMRLEFTLAGVSPLLMHNGAAGLDTRSALSREIAAIAAKRGGNRTDSDDKRLRELECQRSLYLGADGKPTLPEAALRAVIEASARKTKHGSLGPRGVDDREYQVPLRRRPLRRGRREAEHDRTVRRAGGGGTPAHPSHAREGSTARGRSSA